MRALALALLFPSPLMAEVLPSGLDDPLASKTACLALADEVEQVTSPPLLSAIALMESRTIRGIHSEMAKMATDGLNQNPDANEINAVLIRSACREVFR
jgi:hypothetical protein